MIHVGNWLEGNSLPPRQVNLSVAVLPIQDRFGLSEVPLRTPSNRWEGNNQ